MVHYMVKSGTADPPKSASMMYDMFFRTNARKLRTFTSDGVWTDRVVDEGTLIYDLTNHCLWVLTDSTNGWKKLAFSLT